MAAQHRALLDVVRDAVIEIDEHGIILELNPAAERTFGYRRADAIGRSLEQLVIPERLRSGSDRARFAGAELRPGQRVELTAMRANGSELLVELTFLAAEGVHHDRRLVGVLRDLTDDNSAEDPRTPAWWATTSAR